MACTCNRLAGVKIDLCNECLSLISPVFKKEDRRKVLEEDAELQAWINDVPVGNEIDWAAQSIWDKISDKQIQAALDEEPKQSARHNKGKVQTREIDPAFILGIGQVLTKSREKYDHYNWCKPTKLSTPYESAMRHLMAFQSGEDLDKDTQLSHLLHIATNIMFMHYHITNFPETCDDRFFKKKKDE